MGGIAKLKFGSAGRHSTLRASSSSLREAARIAPRHVSPHRSCVHSRLHSLRPIRELTLMAGFEKDTLALEHVCAPPSPV